MTSLTRTLEVICGDTTVVNFNSPNEAIFGQAGFLKEIEIRNDGISPALDLNKWVGSTPGCTITYSLTSSLTDSTLWPASFDSPLEETDSTLRATLDSSLWLTAGDYTFYLHLESHASSLTWNIELTLRLYCGPNSLTIIESEYERT